ncbi:hypothetical protein CHLRE_07g315450v5 [Chlamydomonas reinhardtii]|uniref:Uncharacterized protein n=1 Tax=Chlamydomonas reinhardtii TaxID=3055 RepID=A0A2K3DIN1_CHLRE|nr:uncharacterized protein CHLRE_07g315450v5 [Chlamydomonas reinhardtii]PNW80389.1 hypothetical protein CHLRE_07g315450v5 [Chlamydomonas reinhardtii]
MSRVKRKRTDDFLLADEPTDIVIITAVSEQPLEAHLVVLLPCCKVVFDLPRASSGKTTWDLSKLVLEGQSSPVSSAVVRQWLDLVYSRVDAGRQPPKFPSLSEAARSLLLFADAVGTSRVVMDALGDALAAQPGLALPVVVNGGGGGGEGGAAGGGGGPLQLELALRGKLYYYLKSYSLHAFDVPTSGTVHTVVSGEDLEPFKVALPGAVAAALEGWLYLAGRLGLVALVRLLRDFFQAQLISSFLSILRATAAKVFSRRVLECMPHELLVEGFVSDSLWGPQLGQADVATGSKFSLVMNSEHAAAWFRVASGGQVDGDEIEATNVFKKGGGDNRLRVSVGGMTLAEHQAAMQEVLQQLEEEEAA